MALVLKGTHQLLVSADDVSVKENINSTKNIKTLIGAGLQINEEEIKYKFNSCP
jgi:hypothetical protein